MNRALKVLNKKHFSSFSFKQIKPTFLEGASQTEMFPLRYFSSIKTFFVKLKIYFHKIKPKKTY